MSDLREQLAELSHEQWSGWMEYLFSLTAPELQAGRRCEVIPPDLVERWKRQMKTPYTQLPENEKESDRKEADKAIRLLNELHAVALEAAVLLKNSYYLSGMEEAAKIAEEWPDRHESLRGWMPDEAAGSIAIAIRVAAEKRGTIELPPAGDVK